MKDGRTCESTAMEIHRMPVLTSLPLGFDSPLLPLDRLVQAIGLYLFASRFNATGTLELFRRFAFGCWMETKHTGSLP